MPDEGAPTYQDMLANMQKGLLFIEQEFGSSARPKVAWSIDPFGHSTTYAELNALFGYDFFVVGRIDFQEKAQRFATQSMETVWRTGKTEIMTHVLVRPNLKPPFYLWNLKTNGQLYRIRFSSTVIRLDSISKGIGERGSLTRTFSNELRTSLLSSKRRARAMPLIR
jgi:hypothetical protein